MLLRRASPPVKSDAAHVTKILCHGTSCSSDFPVPWRLPIRCMPGKAAEDAARNNFYLPRLVPRQAPYAPPVLRPETGDEKAELVADKILAGEQEALNR